MYVELHLLHEVLDDIDMAGRAGGKNERRVVEKVEVGAMLDEVAEDVQFALDAGDKEWAEPTTCVLVLSVVVNQQLNDVCASNLGGGKYGRAEGCTDVRVDTRLQKAFHDVVLTFHAGVEDRFLHNPFRKWRVGILR